MGASIDEPAANRCGVRGWGSSSIDRGNFVHSEGFAPLNQCPVARIPDLFALSMFKEFHILEAVHGYGLLRQTQWKFPASGSVHEKGFTLPETIFIGTVFCQGFTPSLLSACPHPWVQYREASGEKIFFRDIDLSHRNSPPLSFCLPPHIRGRVAAALRRYGGWDGAAPHSARPARFTSAVRGVCRKRR